MMDFFTNNNLYENICLPSSNLNDSSRQSPQKVSSFEWIMEFADFKHILEKEFSSRNLQKLKALVVGSGTSMLSYSLSIFGFQTVVSIDNDLACVEFATAKFQNDTKLIWYYWDILEEFTIQSAKSMPEIVEGNFDLVIDKATVDALLTQSHIYKMLGNVYKLLKPNTGVYVVCSAHHDHFIRPLLNLPELGFEASSHVIERRVEGSEKETSGTIVLCRKSTNKSIDLELLSQQEIDFMNKYFIEINPLLTSSRMNKIRNRFESYSLEALPYKDAFEVMFDEEDMLNYDYEFFLEDLSVYKEDFRKEGFMTLEEIFLFLKNNQ